MPKRRADLQVVAHRIDAAIRSGRVAALPIYPLNSDWRGPGRSPTVVLLLESLRIRLPPVYQDGPRRFRAKFERSWDNRTTIPRAVLNSRFLSVGASSPDYLWLRAASLEQRREVGVFTAAGGLKRRIYEVVDDLSHSLRQVVHVQSQYEREIRYLSGLRVRMQDRLRQERAGIVQLTLQERETIRLTLLEADKRLAEIDHILEDRSDRGFRLQYYSRLSSVQLFEMAESLANFHASVSRMANPNMEAVRTYLTGFADDLSLFSSREVRFSLMKAVRTLRHIVRDQLDKENLLRLLDRAVEDVKSGAVSLSHWADSLTEEERLLALA